MNCLKNLLPLLLVLACSAGGTNGSSDDDDERTHKDPGGISGPSVLEDGYYDGEEGADGIAFRINGLALSYPATINCAGNRPTTLSTA